MEKFSKKVVKDRILKVLGILSIIFFKLEYRRILYEHKHKHRSS